MKKFTLYFLLLCAVFVFPLGVYAQKSDATAKALELMNEGRFKDAIAALDKAVGKNKDLYQVYKLRASLKRMTGDFAGAAVDYGLAIEQKSDDGELYEQRAMMRLYSRQDAALILADLDAAVANGRKHEKVYVTRGMIRTQLRDYDGAVADYETAIGLRPDFARAYLGLSTIYVISGQEEKSAEILERFIAIVEKSDTKPQTVKGEVVATSGAVQLPNISGDKNTSVTEGAVVIKGLEGKQMSESMTPPTDINSKIDQLEQSKNTASAYSSLASVYQRRKDLEKASSLVEKSLKIDPNNFSALEVRGKIRTDAGNYTGAISDFDAAIKIMPNMAPTYLARGLAKLRAGSEADAQKDFDKYLQLFPNGKPFLDQEVERVKQKVQQ
ncbi:MAG TPA: tetratricopeptide repeat protein [Pyrinomonadaceae bacterium]|nr:tetratricopeptide repeat protein [Pyrinomonadaceae bacterium]